MVKKFNSKIRDKEGNKQSQVTVFVILGIVIVIVVVAAIFLVSKYKRDQIDSINTGTTEFQEVKDQLDFMFKTCIEGIVKEEAETALLKGGSTEEEFPVNNVKYNGKLIMASFDRDNPYAIFKTGKEISEQLQQKLIDRVPDCFASSNQESLLSRYEINVYLSSVYVTALEDSFMVDYDYTMEIDNKSETHTMSQIIDVSLFKILNEADNITDEFLESYGSPDLLYNLQACNSFYEKYNVKPEYPLDILKLVANNTRVEGVIVQNDFFIVNMNVEGKQFSFAVKPVLVGSIC